MSKHKSKNDSENDLSNIIYNISSSINIKISFLLYLFFLVLNTDTFAESILLRLSSDNYDDTVMCITPKGYMTMGLFLVVFYIIIDIMNQNHMI